ncbi:MAG: hypothetical protein J7539_18385 [Niabella sp.]|nr:hypothetical protein [Niabella sp.]
MKTKILSVGLLSAIVFYSCGNVSDTKSNTPTTENVKPADTSAADKQQITDQPSPIPFTVADHYFVKNTYKKGALTNPKIESQSQFEAIFGTAATMKAQPAPIDFSKQYIIAVIGNETDTATEIRPVQLQQQPNGTIELIYELKKEGGKRTFRITPLLLIRVDKIHSGNVITREK